DWRQQWEPEKIVFWTQLFHHQMQKEHHQAQNQITGQGKSCGPRHQEVEYRIQRNRGRKFITRVEKLAALQQAGGQDIALQLPFMMKDQKISESIENMEGHKTRDWELLKKEMIRKWGRATPLRRFDKQTIPTLISKYEDKGGIQTKEDYRTFIGELEEVLVYLLKMGYQDVNVESGEPLWKAISLEIRKEVARELAHDKKLRKTKDGQNLVPKLEELKDYVEATSSITDLELAGTKVNVACKTATESKKEAKVQPKEEESSQKFKEMEEEIKQLRTAVNTNQNMRTLPPHFSNPRPQNPVYRPPGTGAPPFPRPPVNISAAGGSNPFRSDLNPLDSPSSLPSTRIATIPSPPHLLTPTKPPRMTRTPQTRKKRNRHKSPSPSILLPEPSNSNTQAPLSDDQPIDDQANLTQTDYPSTSQLSTSVIRELTDQEELRKSLNFR
ncbi:hypothetical protein H4Q26_018116, partial [Puccinia striiformis f. sp. tritici PST-130]